MMLFSSADCWKERERENGWCLFSRVVCGLRSGRISVQSATRGGAETRRVWILRPVPHRFVPPSPCFSRVASRVGGGGEKPRSHQVRHAFCGGVKRIQSPTLVLHFLRVAGLHAMGLQHKLPACALEFKHGSRVRELQRTWEDAFCVHLCGRRCVVLLKVTVAVASTWRPLISEGVRDV